jgi:uncharacterized repeat protein (TIGR01451 family)
MNIFKLLTPIDSKQDRQPQKNISQSAWKRSLLLNLTKLSSAALIAVLFPFGQTAFAAITITPKFSNIFYMDDDTGNSNPNIRGMYIGYQITNDGTARSDAWAKIDVPAFGSSANITLGQNEDGVVQLGPMAANETKMAFFYLHTPLDRGGQNSSLPITDSHTLTVYNTRPNQPGATIIGSTSFSYVELQDTIEANANKVTTVVTGPNPAELGGVVTMTVTGNTGTIGGSQEMAFSPATYSNWPANAFELFESKIVFAQTGAVYDNTLSFIYIDDKDSNYTATYKFRAVNTISQPSTVSPVGEIQSGNQIKHTASGNFASFPQIQPPVNKVTLSKLASDSQLTNGGTVTYTLRLNNTGSTDVVVQEMRDTLPTSPGVVTYKLGQATYNGVAIADPTISGSTLTWVGSFVVPAGTSRDLTFKATIPDTEGNYVNSAIAFIGNAQLDTTLDTTNNSPATTTITELPSDYGDAPSLYGSANHGIPTTPTVYLGSVKPDKESGTQLGNDSGAAAAGDDGNNTDDEDAFTALANVPTVGNYNLTVPVTNTSGGNATLHAWIDFNKNSKFEAGEYQSATVANAATSANLSWAVPIGTTIGSTHVRFRLTTDNTLTDDTGTGNQDERSIGAANNGEVEDYPVSISVPIYDYGDAPDTGVGTGTGNYKTTTNDGGAAQVVISTLGQVLSLGNNIDVDDGSLQNSTAEADDNNNTDDEDGVTSFPILTTTAAQTYTVPVSVKNNVPLPNAYLVGYIDFNKDGDFNDTGEKSATVTVPSSTTNPRTFNVTFTTPAGMTTGNTYARFRLGQVQATVESATGASISTDNGEIEDYQIAIASAPPVPTSVTSTCTSPETLVSPSAFTLNSSNYSLNSALQNSLPLSLYNGTMRFNATLSGTGTWSNGVQLRNDATFGNHLYLQPQNTNNYLNSSPPPGNKATYEFSFPSGVKNLSMVVGGLNNYDGTTIVASYQGNSVPISAANFSNLSTGMTLSDTNIDTDSQIDTVVSSNTTGGVEVTENIYTLTIPNLIDKLIVVSGKDEINNNSTATVGFSLIGYCTNFDYGDAPDTYGTDKTANNSSSGGTDPVGARHAIVDTLKLGTNTPDAETDAQTPLNGTGDGTDEDGITTFPSLNTTTNTYSLTATVNNTTGSAANVYGWIDFDGDGKFDEDERATVSNGTINLDSNSKVPNNSNGTVTLTWNNIGGTGANITSGNSFARIRLTTDTLSAASATTTRDSASVTTASDGEVEDYAIAIAVASDPNLLLVKRITAINPGQAGEVQFNNFVDDSGTTNDNNTKWPDSDSTTNNNNSINTYLRGAISVPQIKPGDEVEYTIYFLSNGDADAKNVKICDVVPDNMTFNKHSYGTEVGIRLASDTTNSPTNLSNLIDNDEGSFYAPGTNPPVVSLCKKHNPTNPNSLITVNGGNNLSGAIFIELNEVPQATGSGIPTDSYGFIRFRAKVK